MDLYSPLIFYDTESVGVAIMLSRIKLELPHIRLAIMELDDDKLTLDNLKAISRQLPSNDEMERIKSFEDVSKLSKADRYFDEV